MAAEYRFVSRWSVAATPARCWHELEHALVRGGRAAARMPWWPAVRVTRPAGTIVVGERIGLGVRSPLGYRLAVELILTEVDAGGRLAATSTGDLVGGGSVEVRPAGERTALVWTWEVDVRRPWMRRSAWALAPLFRLAHRAVMRRGARGFAAHLARMAPPL